MPEPPSFEEIANHPDEENRYDFAQASRILQAMDFLRQEAVKTRIPEIIDMVDANFRLLNTSYYCMLRYRMCELPEADGET